jgi:hypothetical protein
MFTLPSPFLVLAAILLFPIVLAGSLVLDVLETEVDPGPAR